METKGPISSAEQTEIELYLQKPELIRLEGFDELKNYFADPPQVDEVMELKAYYTMPKFDPWQFLMTKSFQKDITRIDRKIQGKILSAITNITKNPLTVKGDTVKPLTGDYQGFWRYRIGDYRLIYRPDGKVKRVDLISFKARSAAYG